MYGVSAQGVDECMINVHYYYYYYLAILCTVTQRVAKMHMTPPKCNIYTNICNECDLRKGEEPLPHPKQFNVNFYSSLIK